MTAISIAFTKSLLFAMAAILPIMNPMATAPLFVDLTQDVTNSTRTFLARRIGIYIFAILTTSLLIGSHVLKFFGISLPVVRVAGGLIVAAMAWQMLNTQDHTSPDKEQFAQALSDDYVRMRAFYPMTFPLTCGPGSISVTIAIGASLHSYNIGLMATNLAGGITAMAVIGLLAALTYSYADTIMRWMGRVGKIVFMRLMAFVLLCIGLEILWEGIRSLVEQLK